MSELMSRQQAAEQLEISLRKLDSLVATKEIACYRIGRKVRFKQHCIDEYLVRVTQQAKPIEPQEVEQVKAIKLRAASTKTASKAKATGVQLQVFGQFLKGAS